MIETIEANWPVLAVVLVLALLALWWLLARAGKPAPREHRPDVLDEGVGPARRNQALIDAPPAAQIPAPPPATATVDEVVAVAEQDAAEPVEAKVREVAPPPPAALPEPVPTPVPVELPAPEPAPAPETKPEIQPAIEPLPVPEAPQAEPPAPAPSGADDLALIKGLGPKLQALLPDLGITSFAQIAAFSEADLAALDPKLGPFAGRPARDGWVEQAGYLAAGDVAGFEARFGKV